MTRRPYFVLPLFILSLAGFLHANPIGESPSSSSSSSNGQNANQDPPSTSSCIRLNSALNRNGAAYLITDDLVIKLDENNTQIDISTDADDWSGLGRMDAALNVHDYVYYFKDNKNYIYSLSRGGLVGPIDNEHNWGELINGGVDSAGNFNNEMIMFSYHCRYYLYGKHYGDEVGPKSLGSLGLPCEIDAAFNLAGDDDDQIAVVKFDKLWHVRSNGSVEGPEDANAVITFDGLRLCSEIDVILQSLLPFSHVGKRHANWQEMFGSESDSSDSSDESDENLEERDRKKLEKFLYDWLDHRLGVGSVNETDDGKMEREMKLVVLKDWVHHELDDDDDDSYDDDSYESDESDNSSEERAFFRMMYGEKRGKRLRRSAQDSGEEENEEDWYKKMHHKQSPGLGMGDFNELNEEDLYKMLNHRQRRGIDMEKFYNGGNEGDSYKVPDRPNYGNGDSLMMGGGRRKLDMGNGGKNNPVKKEKDVYSNLPDIGYGDYKQGNSEADNFWNAPRGNEEDGYNMMPKSPEREGMEEYKKARGHMMQDRLRLLQQRQKRNVAASPNFDDMDKYLNIPNSSESESGSDSSGSDSESESEEQRREQAKEALEQRMEQAKESIQQRQERSANYLRHDRFDSGSGSVERHRRRHTPGMTRDQEEESLQKQLEEEERQMRRRHKRCADSDGDSNNDNDSRNDKEDDNDSRNDKEDDSDSRNDKEDDSDSRNDKEDDNDSRNDNENDSDSTNQDDDDEGEAERKEQEREQEKERLEQERELEEERREQDNEEANQQPHEQEKDQNEQENDKNEQESETPKQPHEQTKEQHEQRRKRSAGETEMEEQLREQAKEALQQQLQQNKEMHQQGYKHMLEDEAKYILLREKKQHDRSLKDILESFERESDSSDSSDDSEAREALEQYIEQAKERHHKHRYELMLEEEAKLMLLHKRDKFDRFMMGMGDSSESSSSESESEEQRREQLAERFEQWLEQKLDD